jgi:hypothetical protein
MDEKYKPTYDLYKGKIEKLQDEIGMVLSVLKKYKSIINDLLIESGEKPEYDENEIIPVVSTGAISPVSGTSSAGGPLKVQVKMGEFAVRPLTKAVKEILTRYGDEAMHINEIIDALKRGGVRIGGETDEKKIRNSILKNTANFKLVGDNHFMLKPKSLTRREKSKKSSASNGEEGPQLDKKDNSENGKGDSTEGRN